MCNHKYITDRYGYGPNGNKCPYTQMYHELPLDRNGVCLFHSNDLNWKRENQFTTKFLQLVQLLDEHSNIAYYDFSEFVFVGKPLKSTKNSEPWVFKFSETVFRKEATFLGALFTDPVELLNVKFKNGANFKGAIFKKGLEMQKCSVGSSTFDEAVFEKNVYFEDTHFSGTYTTFVCSVFNKSAKFVNSTFDGMAIFSEAIFNKSKDRDSMTEFADVEFSFKKDMKGTIRLKNVNFNNISNVSRKRIIQLSKVGKVEIGPGCIKYRFQTETKTIFIGKDNQFLILIIIVKKYYSV